MKVRPVRFFRGLFHLVLLAGLVGCAGTASSSAPLSTFTPLVIPGTTVTPRVFVYTQPPAGDSPSPSPRIASATPFEPGPTASASSAPTATPQSAAPTPTFDPQSWSGQPVVPVLGPRAIEILRQGLAKGNNPRAFSKIGDCESQASWFLGDFDLGPQYYALGPYESDLAPVISYYAGSFKRVSLAARPGFTAASLMAPIWADKQKCEKGETPLACEYRVQKPIVAFIMLGSNDASNPGTFEGHMRKVIEYSLEQGVLPVLGTKADNVEGDNRVNITISRLAYEYGLPLWNYWAAVQDLPGHGLQEDQVHLTFGVPRFNDPAMMKKAWPVRNLNALQILKTIMDQTQ